MKNIKWHWALALLYVIQTSHAQNQYNPNSIQVNPTGHYTMGAPDKNGYGYSGGVSIKMLKDSKIAICFIVCEGAPSFNMGIVHDTLILIKNQAVYTTPEYDSTCRVTFTFSEKGVKVEETTADYNSGCGFGHAVVANGFYRRKNTQTPTDKELLIDF